MLRLACSMANLCPSRVTSKPPALFALSADHSSPIRLRLLLALPEGLVGRSRWNLPLMGRRCRFRQQPVPFDDAMEALRTLDKETNAKDSEHYRRLLRRGRLEQRPRLPSIKRGPADWR
jgi:hypothetical protein